LLYVDRVRSMARTSSAGLLFVLVVLVTAESLVLARDQLDIAGLPVEVSGSTSLAHLT